MAKYCGKCGSKLNEQGKCSNCNNKIFAKKNVLVRGIIIFALIGMITTVVLVALFDKNEGDIELTDIDVEAYYEKNSTIIEKLPVKDSSEVLTEDQAIQVFHERGFNQNKVLAEYSMNGEYQPAFEISGASDKKYPKYIYYYTTQSGDFWTILIYNGQVLANPLSYNLQSGKQVQLIVSETNQVTAYDSENNMFYKIIPNETMLKVICVEKISADAIEQFTFEELDLLW